MKNIFKMFAALLSILLYVTGLNIPTNDQHTLSRLHDLNNNVEDLNYRPIVGKKNNAKFFK